MQNIFGFIIHPMEIGLIWLAVAVGTAGIGIILFTIFVRLVLSPLQIVQLRNAKSMQRVQPLLADLKQRHGKDRQALSQATMELYREHKVNPAMGCLPTLLQFPILIGLFYALLHLGNTLPTRFPVGCDGFSASNKLQWLQHCYGVKGASGTAAHAYDLFHANFLWLSHGLGQPDPLYVLPVLAGVTQWVQSRMMLTRALDQQQQMMNTMMNFMPLMIVFFATRYASGLSLYWVTSTLIGILIQYRITGWGLLPETVRGFAANIQSRGATRPTPQRQVKRSTAVKPPREIRAMPVDKGSDVEATGTNGKNGANTVSPRVPGTAQRKKANRARGGRGGGRRG